MSMFEPSFVGMERLLGIGLTVHDLAGVFCDSHGQPLLGPQRQSHKPRAVCRLGFSRRCREHCRGTVNQRAARESRPFTSECWKQVTEIVVPIFRGGTHVATLFAGSWRDDRPRPSAPPLPVRMVDAWHELPVLEPEHAQALMSVLAPFGHGLLDLLDENNDVQGETRYTRIRAFLRHRAHEAIRLNDLAADLGLSPSRTSHVVKELFGSSFQRLLHEERLRRAHALLVSTDLTVSEIADRIGYTNPYHLIRAFKQAYGWPPARYRAVASSGSGTIPSE